MRAFSRVLRGVSSQIKGFQFLRAGFSLNNRLFKDAVEEEEIPGIPYKELFVGVINEKGESRVAQSPASVEDLVNKGFSVMVEKGCGLEAKFSDELYKDAGAQLVEKPEEILKKVDILLKIHPPTEEEIGLLREGAQTMSFLYPGNNEKIVDAMVKKNITGFGMECVPRISRAQVFDALSSQANIAGYKAVIEAANYFPGFFAGQMTAAGRVDAAKILVIGAGVAGLAAIQTGKNMGAIVRSFDTRPEVKEQIEAMGGQFLMLDFDEDGSGEGGYAKTMSDEFYEAEMALFAKQAREVDIIITTALIPGREAPILIKKEHIDAMKPGSVVVDLAAEAGGNIETTKPGEIYNYNGVTHIGMSNFPSQLPTVSSNLYSNNIRKLLYSFGGKGKLHIDLDDVVTRGSLVSYQGELMWPPPPIEVAPVADVKEIEVVEKKELTMMQKVAIKAGVMAVALGTVQSIGFVKDHDLLNMFSMFSLGGIIGYKVVTDVLPALHSPLISVTNAVSGIIICGGMLLMPLGSHNRAASIFGGVSVLISSVNVFGGFLITHKMLQMFVKPDDPPAYNSMYAIPAALSGLMFLIGSRSPLIHEGTNLMASICCILALGALTQHSTSQMGNIMGMTGVGLGILATLGSMKMGAGTFGALGALTLLGGGAGLFVANKTPLTELPQLVALFHSFVGLAACFISVGSYLAHPDAGLLHDLSVSLGTFIGGVTFTGSVLAFAKLQGLMASTPIALPGKNFWNLGLNGSCLALSAAFCGNHSVGAGIAMLSAITALSFAAGAHMTAAIGGADMPVVITVLNSYSGWALCAEGFLLNNKLLTIVGSLVGASGAILSGIMCKAMNRSILNVLFEGVKVGTQKEITGTHTETTCDTVGSWLCDAQSVVIVPGFGLAVSKGQYAIADMCAKLTAAGKTVKFAIHPVAGRMPGQLNVLLAEAGVPHDVVYEMEEVEEEMNSTDLVLCIGSNDIYNSSANDDEGSPIFGMPVIPVWEADRVVVFKRTMGVGYSAIDNPVFYNENTSMLLGDAKDSAEKLLSFVGDNL